MPRHIEQPALRHSKPAAWKVSCKPSASAALATCCEPGTISARTPLATLPFFATSAAMRRSDRRPLVHEPTKATSIFAPLIGWPAWKLMWASASRKVERSASGADSGAGMRWLTPTDMPGLMPHVTIGSMALPSRRATSSNEAPGSVATDFPHAAALSNVAHLGGADAEGDRADGAVGRGVAVAARDRHAGLREAELGTDHVHNALLARRHVEERQAEVLHVADHVDRHLLGQRIGVGAGLVGRRDDVIERAEGALGHPDFQLRIPEHLKRLRCGHLVDEMQADQELGLSRRQGPDGMCVPHFVEQRACHTACLLVRRMLPQPNRVVQ